jgi:hypothetical protein
MPAFAVFYSLRMPWPEVEGHIEESFTREILSKHLY